MCGCFTYAEKWFGFRERDWRTRRSAVERPDHDADTLGQEAVHDRSCLRIVQCVVLEVLCESDLTFQRRGGEPFVYVRNRKPGGRLTSFALACKPPCEVRQVC